MGPASESLTLTLDIKAKGKFASMTNKNQTCAATSIGVNGRNINVEIYRPENGSRAPGILYLHEVFGMLDVYREDARELASRGYVVYLPDLYSGNAGGYCIRAIVASAGRNNHSGNPLMQEIHALLDAVKLDGSCNGKIGMLGMCLTGGFVIQAALREDMIAPVLYHHSLGVEGAGVPRSEEDSLVNIKRLQGHWSKVDPFCPRQRRERLKTILGDRLDAHVYNIPHGFRSSARATRSAQLAWERTLAFFDQHLSGVAPTENG